MDNKVVLTSIKLGTKPETAYCVMSQTMNLSHLRMDLTPEMELGGFEGYDSTYQYGKQITFAKVAEFFPELGIELSSLTREPLKVADVPMADHSSGPWCIVVLESHDIDKFSRPGYVPKPKANKQGIELTKDDKLIYLDTSLSTGTANHQIIKHDRV